MREEIAMSEIKNNVKVYRKEKKMTQELLAKEIDVSRRTIVSLEKGNYMPSLLLALKIAKVLNQDINDLFKLEEK